MGCAHGQEGEQGNAKFGFGHLLDLLGRLRRWEVHIKDIGWKGGKQMKMVLNGLQLQNML